MLCIVYVYIDEYGLYMLYAWAYCYFPHGSVYLKICCLLCMSVILAMLSCVPLHVGITVNSILVCIVAIIMCYLF